jgi:hypothetical protein
MASGVDAAAAGAAQSYLFFCAETGNESADRNRFSTELSPDFGDNADQYLV